MAAASGRTSRPRMYTENRIPCWKQRLSRVKAARLSTKNKNNLLYFNNIRNTRLPRFACGLHDTNRGKISGLDYLASKKNTSSADRHFPQIKSIWTKLGHYLKCTSKAWWSSCRGNAQGEEIKRGPLIRWTTYSRSHALHVSGVWELN